jgi:GT2 family glycosyltransferase
VTYNAEDRIKQSSITVPSWVKHFVIVNDGTPYDENSYPKNAHIIQHETNQSVGGAKNSAIEYLLNQGCEHIFIMEDDVLIKDENVFDKYIQTSLHTGIKHLNYGLQGPANRKGAQGFETLEERAEQDVTGDPNPREIVRYSDDIEVSLYPNSVGAFSYYQREVLEKIGGFDRFYKNAWEHVDHTLEAFKNGYTTPYWWFADINKSWEYLEDIENCIENSTIAKSDQWKENNKRGFLYFKQKHGYGPVEVPNMTKEDLHKVLTNLYQLR